MKPIPFRHHFLNNTMAELLSKGVFDASQSTLYIWNRCSLGNGKPSAGHISQCQGKALMQIILGMLCMRAHEIWNRKLHYYLLILFHSQSCWRSTVGRLTMPFSPRRKLSLRSWRSTRFDTSRYRWCLHPLHVGHRSGWSHCWWSYSELNQGGTVAPGWTSNDDFEMFWNGATCFV